MASSKSIITTKNYRLFQVSEDNRPLDISKRKALRDSMKTYGFLKSFPISCIKKGGKLVVKDGQNRLALAEELGLAVHYVIEDVDYDIATINNAQEKWTMKDYAMKWAAQEKESYVQLLGFIDFHAMPIGLGTALLCGQSHLNGDLMRRYKAGMYKISDYDFADRVAGVYTQMVAMSAAIKSRNCLAAIIAAMRVTGFEPKRLLDGAKKRPEKLKAYSTRDCYLEMIEELYNFNRQKLVPVKMPALQVLRDRDVAPDSHKKKGDTQ
jgi:hypothetical protein